MAYATSGIICALIISLIYATTSARQIRINRFSTEIAEDNNATVVVATVREVKPTPYPAAGYRPGRAFNLPGEEVDEASASGTTTTEYPLDLSTTTTASDLDSTTLFNEVPAEIYNDDAGAATAAKAPYPAAGYRPSRAFLLPTEQKAKDADSDSDTDVVDAIDITTTAADNDVDSTTTVLPTTVLQKAPYPAAGYRPSRAFVLPTELVAATDSLVTNSTDRSEHPVCGSNDNPIAPKPVEGTKDDPDAERVFVTAAVGPAIITAPLPATRVVPLAIRSQPLIAQPIFIAPGAARRPFAYSAHVQTW